MFLRVARQGCCACGLVPTAPVNWFEGVLGKGYVVAVAYEDITNVAILTLTWGDNHLGELRQCASVFCISLKACYHVSRTPCVFEGIYSSGMCGCHVVVVGGG